jgi:hypothetical protein
MRPIRMKGWVGLGFRRRISRRMRALILFKAIWKRSLGWGNLMRMFLARFWSFRNGGELSFMPSFIKSLNKTKENSH